MTENQTQNEDTFTQALRVLMTEGGFRIYRVYTPDPENPESVIEALLLARSPEMLEAACMDVISRKANSVH